MSRIKIAAAIALASGFAAFAQSGAEARIVCDGNFQRVGGNAVSTLYCQEQELVRVARMFGWRVTAAEIRNSESKKAEVCRAIGFDNRVYQICSPFQPFGGDGRYSR